MDKTEIRFILIYFFMLGVITISSSIKIFDFLKGINALSTLNRVEAKPVLREKAVAAPKYSETIIAEGEGFPRGDDRISTIKYVVFELEIRKRMRFYLYEKEFEFLTEGDVGILTFQEANYIGFDQWMSVEEI